MPNITGGWMYPDLLNLHGERGSVQALVQVGKKMGVDMDVIKILDFDDPIPFEKLDLLLFLPGEIAVFQHLIPALNSQALTDYLENGGYALALGTTGLLFGKSITREDGSVLDALGYLDMTAKERKFVWGDDLHFHINGTQIELRGSQIMMADVDAKDPLGTTIYGRGNNGTGNEGARWKNLIYTNCMGPLFVKNPWFAESILKNILKAKDVEMDVEIDHTIAASSFKATKAFIDKKPTK